MHTKWLWALILFAVVLTSCSAVEESDEPIAIKDFSYHVTNENEEKVTFTINLEIRNQTKSERFVTLIYPSYITRNKIGTHPPLSIGAEQVTYLTRSITVQKSGDLTNETIGKIMNQDIPLVDGITIGKRFELPSPKQKGSHD
ncbi:MULTISPECIES: hypothetical protein [Pontibacillus]|uniref:Lipoprotein n=1 Tax=Pontibacillus chungwhensis TaxID=265426 RepID=A0ABY8US94_9BACI|nr:MULTISPECIES: hypothetical protein [Pontibacillus]MCD5323154.1 hypothetical protein [Pontibacillus sp. HN14]WIF96542.1 hypothetical protein QNI29_12350 [Pontibacillus chungwhensis]